MELMNIPNRFSKKSGLPLRSIFCRKCDFPLLTCEHDFGFISNYIYRLFNIRSDKKCRKCNHRHWAAVDTKIDGYVGVHYDYPYTKIEEGTTINSSNHKEVPVLRVVVKNDRYCGGGMMDPF